MPITNPKDREQLKALGFDPDQYNDIAIQQTEQQTPPAKITTPFGAGARSLVRNIPSAGIGLGVGGLVSSGASPLIGIPAGILTGMGVKWGQDKLLKMLPDELGSPIINSEIKDTSEHPTASAIGGALSSLPFLRPDIKGLSGLAKTLVGGEVTPIAKETAKNLALNAGLQGGIGATIKGIQQKTFTPELNSDDALSAAIGAILNKPTTIGNKIGLAPKIVKPVETSVEKFAPIEYIGEQEAPNGGSKKLFNLTEDHPELGIKGSTISDQVLTKKGYKLPEEKSAPAIETKPDEPIVEQPKIIVPEPIKELPVKTFDELLEERSKYERGTPEFQRAHAELMAKLESESKPIEVPKEEPLKPEDKIATEELNKKLETAKQEGIDITDDATIKAIHESPVESKHLIEEPTAPKQRFIYSAIDDIRKQGPEGLAAGDKMANFYNKVTQLRGRLVNSFGNNVRKLSNLDGIINKIKSPKDYITQNTPELEKVRDWFWSKFDKTISPILSPREEAIKNEFIRSNKDVRDLHIASGIPTSGTHNPDYLAMSIDPHVINTLKNKPFSNESSQFKKDFIDYQVTKLGKPLAEAVSKLEAITNNSADKLNNTTAQFGPIDKAAGEGIPISWRNKNIIDSQNRYLVRATRRFAYESEIKPHEALINQFIGNKSGQAVMHDIIGARENYDDPIVSQVSGVIRSTMMGTMTGERDFGSNLTLGFQHIMPVKAAVNMVKSWATMKQNIAEGFETGRIRNHMNSLEFGNGFDDVVGGLKRFRDVISDVTGRNWFDQMARASSIGQGRFTTLDFLEQLNKGNLSKTGTKWFQDFAKDMPWKSGKLTPEQIKEVSARYVDSTQGTYDYRMLPRQAVEGSFSPILSLARWNIEKSNNFIKYNIHPAMDGNFKPLLASTIGIVLGGAAVKAITTAMTGRKDRDASIKELLASKEAGNNITLPLFYKFAGLASAAGHIGFIGDLTKSLLDVTYGKVRPQVYNNVLLEFAENAATMASQYAQSVAQDGFNWNTLGHAIATMLENTVQNYRLISGYLSADKQSDIDKANKFRDLRVFNTLSGNKITDLSSPFHVSLEDVKLKKFKNETDISKVPDELIPLIDRAWNRSGGDVEKFKRELGSLKQNSYQTFPNPKQAKSFSDYYDFLEKTQGKTEALNRLVDYATRNKINKMKSKAIP